MATLKKIILFFLLFFTHFHTFCKEQKTDVVLVGHNNVTDGIGKIIPWLLDFLSNELSFATFYNLKERMPQTNIVFYAHVLDEFGQNDSLPKNSINIAYSLFEASKIPSHWVSTLNTHFDCVISYMYGYRLKILYIVGKN